MSTVYVVRCTIVYAFMQYGYGVAVYGVASRPGVAFADRALGTRQTAPCEVTGVRVCEAVTTEHTGTTVRAP